MPSLKQLQCNIELTDSAKTQLPEYKTSYADGVVNTFVAVPSKAVGFCIKLRSHGYIASGLGAFVFIDGIYQCNRVRRGLVPRVDRTSTPRTEVSFTFRQQETPKDGNFEVRDWRFEKLNIAAADDESNAAPTADSVGTIAVVVLRCKPDTQPGYVPRDPNEPSKPPTRRSTPKQTSAKKAPTVPSIREEEEGSIGGMGGLFDGAFDNYHPTIYDSDPSNASLYDELGRRRYSYGSGSYQNESFYLDARAFFYFSPQSAHRHSGSNSTQGQSVRHDVSRENLEIYLASLGPPTAHRSIQARPTDEPFRRTFPTERSPGVSRARWSMLTHNPHEDEDPYLSAGDPESAWPDHIENRYQSRAGFDGNNSRSNSTYQGWDTDNRQSGGSDTSRRSATFEPVSGWPDDPFDPKDNNPAPTKLTKVEPMVFGSSASIQGDPFLNAETNNKDDWVAEKVKPMVFETKTVSKPGATADIDPFSGSQRSHHSSLSDIVFDAPRPSQSGSRSRSHRSRHSSPSAIEVLLKLQSAPDPPKTRDWATEPATPSAANIPLPSSRSVSYASASQGLIETVLHSPHPDPDPFMAHTVRPRRDSLESLKPPSHISNHTYHSHSHRSGSVCTNRSCNAYISMTGPALSGGVRAPHPYHGLDDESTPPPPPPASRSSGRAKKREEKEKQKDQGTWGSGDKQPTAATWGPQDDNAVHGWIPGSPVSANDSWPDLGGSAVNAWGPTQSDAKHDAADPWAEFQTVVKPSIQRGSQQGGNGSHHSYHSARSHHSEQNDMGWGHTSDKGKGKEKENSRPATAHKTPSQSSKTNANRPEEDPFLPHTPSKNNQNADNRSSSHRPVSPAVKTWPDHTSGPDIHGWNDTVATNAHGQTPAEVPWGGSQNGNGAWRGSQNPNAANDQSAPSGQQTGQGETFAAAKTNNADGGSKKGSVQGSQKGSNKGSQKGSIKGSVKGNNNANAGPSQQQNNPPNSNANANVNTDLSNINSSTPGGWPNDPPSGQTDNQQQQQQPQNDTQSPDAAAWATNQDQTANQDSQPWGDQNQTPNDLSQPWVEDPTTTQPPDWNQTDTQNQNLSQQPTGWDQDQTTPAVQDPFQPTTPAAAPAAAPADPSASRPSNTSRRRAERLHPYTTPPVPSSAYPRPSWFDTFPSSAVHSPTPTPHPHIFPPPVTATQAMQLNLDAQVSPGPVATYHHRVARPEYIDSLEAPYAVFTFQYRSRSKCAYAPVTQMVRFEWNETVRVFPRVQLMWYCLRCNQLVEGEVCVCGWVVVRKALR